MKFKASKESDGFPGRLRPALILIILVIFTESAMALSLNRFYEILPSVIDGYKKTEKPVLYTKNDLYQYIDGGAELYISYSFKELLAVSYKALDESEIIVDFFDMGRSCNAFGIFSYSREKEDKLLGQGSEYNSGLLTFWKDRYYVSIMAYPESKKKKQIALKLGRLLGDAIPAEGEMPSVIGFLPPGHIIPDSVRFFHHHVSINNHYFIANENILQIDEETQVVLAKYKTGDQGFYLLLALYPDQPRAQNAGESFMKNYLHDAQEGKVKRPDGKWYGCGIKDRLLAVIFGSPTKEILDSCLKLVMGK